MPYIHFTEDQKLRANSVDLVEFLRRQGEKLISSGQDKRLTSDHSIIGILLMRNIWHSWRPSARRSHMKSWNGAGQNGKTCISQARLL